MISLAEDCLIFQTTSGEGVPFSAEMISVELIGDATGALDPDFVRHAAAAVFHYFRVELGRESVTVAEFTEALEKILHGSTLPTPELAVPTGSPAGTLTTAPAPGPNPVPMVVVESDLCRLVEDSDKGCELLFFPRLRDELRAQLRQSPRMLRFLGLRGCVKRLAGARRWNHRCSALRDQIVDYLRRCASQEGCGIHCSLVVK